MALDPSQDPNLANTDWWAINAPPAIAGPAPLSPDATGQSFDRGAGATPADTSRPFFLPNSNVNDPANAAASAYNAGHPSAATITPSVTDPAYITQQVTAFMQQHGITPGPPGSGQGDVAYWSGRIAQTGGWQGGNVPYWQNLIQKNQGGDAGGGALGVSPGFGQAPAPYQSVPSTVAPYVTPPAAAATLATPFVPPSSLTAQNDPGYLARFQLGQTALEQSAAAKGSVLSGGFQKALNQYAQDYASNEYSNVYNRALSSQQQNVGQAQATIGNANTQFQNQYSQYLNENSRTLSDYLTNFGVGNTTQTNLWNRLFQQAQQGQQAAANPGP